MFLSNSIDMMKNLLTGQMPWTTQPQVWLLINLEKQVKPCYLVRGFPICRHVDYENPTVVSVNKGTYCFLVNIDANLSLSKQRKIAFQIVGNTRKENRFCSKLQVKVNKLLASLQCSEVFECISNKMALVTNRVKPKNGGNLRF